MDSNFATPDAVDCLEWIVPYHVFKALAEEYELDLVLVKYTQEFVHEYLKRPEYVEMMRRLGALGDGNQDQSAQSPDEWEVAYLYLSFVLRKRGQPDRSQVNGGRDKGKLRLEKEYILYINNDLWTDHAFLVHKARCNNPAKQSMKQQIFFHIQ